MSKICVISGATSGIGEAVAMKMASLDWELAIIGRSAEKGRVLLSRLTASNPGCKAEYFTADLSTVRSISAVANEVSSKYPVIDALINNAGGVFSTFELTEDGIEKTMANNHINFFVLTLGLLDNLKRSADARIISVSSATHYKAELKFDSFTANRKYFIMRAYAQSKLANVYFTYALSRRLEGSSVSAYVIHPGVVATPIGLKSSSALHRFAWKLFAKFRTKMTPEESAETYVYLATDPDARQHAGKYFHAGVLQESAPSTYDVDAQEQLWAWSEEITGISMNKI